MTVRIARQHESDGGDIREAEKNHRAVLDLKKRVFGVQAYEFQVSDIMPLVEVLRLQNRLVEAREVLLELAAAKLEQYGDNSMRLVTTYEAVFEWHLRLKDRKESDRYSKLLVRLRDAYFKGTHDIHLTSMLESARLQLLQENWAGAEGTCNSVVDSVSRRFRSMDLKRKMREAGAYKVGRRRHREAQGADWVALFKIFDKTIRSFFKDSCSYKLDKIDFNINAKKLFIF